MTRLLLLAEDDAAPDAREYFEKHFFEVVGKTVREFEEVAYKRELDDGYAVEYCFGDLVLTSSADSPWYELYRFCPAPCDTCANRGLKLNGCSKEPCTACRLTLGYQSYKKA